jgi:hypothetical protein
MVISCFAEIIGFLRAALVVLPMSISCFRQLRLALYKEIGRASCKWFFMICDVLINLRLWRVSMSAIKPILSVQVLATYIL